jgi:hypothetical protein
MRKLSVSRHAVEQIKSLPADDRKWAADAIALLQEGKELGVRMIGTERAPQLWTFSFHELVIVFRQLRDQIVILGVFASSRTRYRIS